jgi:hypothetical protein
MILERSLEGRSGLGGVKRARGWLYTCSIRSGEISIVVDCRLEAMGTGGGEVAPPATFRCSICLQPPTTLANNASMESPSDFAGHTEFAESSTGRRSTWARIFGPQIGGQQSISPQQFISISGGTIRAGLQLGLRCDLLQANRDLDAGAGLQHMHMAAWGNLESG